MERKESDSSTDLKYSEQNIHKEQNILDLVAMDQKQSTGAMVTTDKDSNELLINFAEKNQESETPSLTLQGMELGTTGNYLEPCISLALGVHCTESEFDTVCLNQTIKLELDTVDVNMVTSDSLKVEVDKLELNTDGINIIQSDDCNQYVESLQLNKETSILTHINSLSFDLEGEELQELGTDDLNMDTWSMGTDYMEYLDQDTGSTSLVLSRSFSLIDDDKESLELSTAGVNCLSSDSSTPDVEYMAGISLAPVELLHVGMVSKHVVGFEAAGEGLAPLHSLQFGMIGTDWHMGSLPMKCLELGAVNITSLTLGTVGIGVVPLISDGAICMDPLAPGTMPMQSIEWETESTDTISLGTPVLDSVIVDSLKPEGVRECWDPLEERLCALGDALNALDKKLERFSPQLQEAGKLLSQVESSLTQHAIRIYDIDNGNSALAERIMKLEEQVREERAEARETKKNKECLIQVLGSDSIRYTKNSR